MENPLALTDRPLPSAILHPPFAPPVINPAPNPELLHSLGRLVRGLSALFWGLPTLLLVGVYTAWADWLRLYHLLPPVGACGWILYGLWQLGHFQKQERVWIEVVNRAKLLGLILLGLSPFLYFRNRAPGELHFTVAVLALAAVGLLFLAVLNLVLRRLSAMLPDETLRLETNHFTGLNRGLLFATLVLTCAYYGLSQVQDLPESVAFALAVADHLWHWLAIVLILLPVAMTMALLWKTKEVIFDSVFNHPANH